MSIASSHNKGATQSSERETVTQEQKRIAADLALFALLICFGDGYSTVFLSQELLSPHI